MKIAQIITNLELGGAQKATISLTKWLINRGYDVFLVTSAQGFLFAPVSQQLKNNLYCIKYLVRPINPVFDFIAFIRLYLFLKYYKPDIVHTHTSKAGIIGRWAAKLAGVKKIIHTIHGFAFNQYQPFLLRYFYILAEKVTSYITDKLIAVAPEVKNKGLKHRIGKLRQYHLIPEIVDIPSIDKRETYQKNGKIKIGMVACLKPQKSPDTFLKAARILLKQRNDLIFFLVGDGPLRRKLENSIERSKLNGSFIIMGWREDAYQLMNQWDVVVLTSLWEGLPHVIVEAFSLGKPVIASAVDGIKDVIKDGINGLLFQPGNYRELADKMLTVLNDNALRKKLAEQAYFSYMNNKWLSSQECMSLIEKIYLAKL